MLKPQDLIVLLKLVSLNGSGWTIKELATSIKLSPSEVSSSLQRIAISRLYNAKKKKPRISSLKEFIFHGVKYIWPAKAGTLTRGMPTSYAAPPLNKVIIQSPTEWPPVWPSADGNTRGYEFQPLYISATTASKNDNNLYELLALVDAIREGRPRESSLAKVELEKRFTLYENTV